MLLFYCVNIKLVVICELFVCVIFFCRQALYSPLTPTPSSYVYNPQFLSEFFTNPRKGEVFVRRFEGSVLIGQLIDT